MKKIFLIFTFIFFACAFCYGGGISLLNDTDITVGDNITVKVEAKGFNPDFLNKDALSKLDFGDFSLRSAAMREDGVLILTITAFKTGNLVVPALKIPFADGKTLDAGPLNIEIKSVLDANNPPRDILDIKPIIKFARLPPWYLIWGFTVFAAAMAYAIYRLTKRKKTSAVKAAPEFVMPPKDFALMELEKLKNSGLMEQNLVKEYYDRLSDILRYYISRVYNVDLMGKTTSEIYGVLNDTLSTTDNITLKNFLQTCDFAKFAKFAPGDGDAEIGFETAKGLIEKL